jgi:predicted aspartyl protease
MFKVSITATNPKREELITPAVEALVDTGSELTWLPGEVLKNIGITPRRERTFMTADKKVLTRPVGYAILRSEGFETNDEVVFAEPGDMTLLGVRTIEGFGVLVDNIGHRFVATTTIVATAGDTTTEVLMSLPSPEEILRRAEEAKAKAAAALAKQTS